MSEVDITAFGGPSDGETIRVPLTDGEPPRQVGNTKESRLTGDVLAHSYYQSELAPDQPSGWKYVFVEETPGPPPLS
jgi:hypothetical protein